MVLTEAGEGRLTIGSAPSSLRQGSAVSESLFLRYRPTEFKDMVGQELTSAVLSGMASKQDVYPALLFSGPSGTGKTSAARILARSLEGARVIEIDAASNRGVDSVRDLADSLNYGSGNTVVILDEAHNLTREAFNALLKTLEEPLPGVVFALLTTDPSQIPDTVLSRTMEFEFRRLTPLEVLNRLIYVSSQEKIDVSEELLKVLAVEAEGNLRSALTLLEFASLAEIREPSEYHKLTGMRDYAPSLLRAMMSGNDKDTFELLDKIVSFVPSPEAVSEELLRLFRDLLVIRAGGRGSDDVRKSLAVELSREELGSCVSLMWDLRTKTRHSSDSRGSLEMVVILLSGMLSKSHGAPQRVVKSTEVRPSSGEGSEVMSLAQMRAS